MCQVFNHRRVESPYETMDGGQLPLRGLSSSTPLRPLLVRIGGGLGRVQLCRPHFGTALLIFSSLYSVRLYLSSFSSNQMPLHTLRVYLSLFPLFERAVLSFSCSALSGLADIYISFSLYSLYSELVSFPLLGCTGKRFA